MNRFLLTPFVVDRLEPQLRCLWREGWTLNEPSLPNGTVTNSATIIGPVTVAVTPAIHPSTTFE
jgi:hypothetical protein